MMQQMDSGLPQMGPSSRARAVRQCSRRLLDLAHSGSPRLEFIRNAIEMLHRLISCDTVRIVLVDRDRRFSARAHSDDERRSHCQVSRDESASTGHPIWTGAPNDPLEDLCRRVAREQTDDSLPWFTESGCLVVNDLDRFPHRLMRTDADLESGLSLSAQARSVMVLPIEGTRRLLGLMQLESHEAGFFESENFDHYERLAQTFGLALDVRNLHIALRERVKELSCLYGIVRLFARAELSTAEMLQQAVLLLGPGWLYPEVAAARIVLDDRAYVSAAAENIVQSMTAPIVINNCTRGSVEVGYTVEKPPIDEGPFLVEERHLIDTVAQELAFVVEQKTVADERKRLQEQLRHADRLATIGQLAAGVAHELNEPLSTIVGFAQLASRNEELPSDVSRDLNKIVTAALHARKIIKELLVFAREATPVKVSCDLNELIKDGLFFLESRFVKVGITLACELDPNLPTITADRSQILQVLTNLVVNSVQAMPDGGRLTIATHHSDGFVTLVVADTGEGMSERTINEIFHPFFTTKEVDEGTGLGLSVVHGIVASHNGTIDVDSKPGEGTRFTIRLPMLEKPHHAKEVPGA
ncbi:hypothetical protein GF420_02575 [candidate division GN15 bacterium]|nr:hypothetical protein [candidate division GN15 bacterium]